MQIPTRHPSNTNAAGLEAPVQLTLYARAHFVRFESFLEENPKIWVLFEKFTLEVIRSGLSHYSADAICHRIRWHCEVETRGDDFKVNNNHVAFLARHFERAHPEHVGFFRLRGRRTA